MNLKIKKLHPEAIIPQYQSAGAACFDLHALFPHPMNGFGEPETVPLITSHVFRTGLAFEVPEGFVMLVFSRSGQGFKYDVRLANCVGVIDSDYRGELRIKLTPDIGANGLSVRHGDRIAQAMLMPVQQWSLTEVEDLTETVRGDGAYGSTGFGQTSVADCKGRTVHAPRMGNL